MKKIQKFITIIAIVCASSVYAHVKLYANIRVEKTLPQLPLPIVKTGQASWYSHRSPGIRRHTANNEIFDDNTLTAAMWGVPFNQMVKVTNKATGKSVIVRINDRGPHRRYVKKGRVIDLSKKAFTEISSLRKGLIEVEIEFL